MTKILNCTIQSVTKKYLLENLSNGVLITPNVDHLVKLQKDKDFYDCYQAAEWVVCDSKILFLLSKLLREPIPEAIPGSSFFTSFYEYHRNDKDCRIFLLGAAEGVAHKAMTAINEKIGREIVVSAYSPSFGFERDEQEIANIIEKINSSSANVVMVGVGAPKQEKFIMKYKNQMPNVKLWMALGATIDFEAGNVNRAPAVMQKLALEWLYRIWCEPKRMFKRYFGDDLVFFIYFFKQLIGVYRNPFENTTNDN